MPIIKSPTFTPESTYVLSKTLKVSDWDSTTKTQTITFDEPILDGSLISWTLDEGYTNPEYLACVRGEINASLADDKVSFVFTTLKVPTVDINIMIVIEDAKVEERPAPAPTLTFKRFTAYSLSEFYMYPGFITYADYSSAFVGKSAKDIIGDIDGTPAVTRSNSLWYWDGFAYRWVLPVALNIDGFVTFLCSEGSVEADDPELVTITGTIDDPVHTEEVFTQFANRLQYEFVTKN